MTITADRRFRLVDVGWDSILDRCLRTDHTTVRIICPFIKHAAALRLLKRGRPDSLKVITRFNLRDFADGVSDIAALQLLLDSGAMIRGVKNLHAKLYLVGKTHAILTSANLTEAALTRNHEFGFVAHDPAIMITCGQYFDQLWGRAGANLSSDRLDRWEGTIAECQVGGSRTKALLRLGDEGVDARCPLNTQFLHV
jgi:phosphatidylserine/phosphatidylglycerophosphate/cardiolipin synthase-like enzyme